MKRKECIVEKKNGCSITIPHDILKNENLTALMVRLDISPAKTSQLLQVLITECGGNPSHVDLSYSSSRRFREKKSRKLLWILKKI